MLASIHIENASALFHAADQYTAHNLRDKCLRFILLNFDEVTQTYAFENMARINVDLVFDILRARAAFSGGQPFNSLFLGGSSSLSTTTRPGTPTNNDDHQVEQRLVPLLMPPPPPPGPS